MLFRRTPKQPSPPADAAPPPAPPSLWQRLREMADSMEEADEEPG